MSVVKDTKIDELVEELQNRINEGFYVAGQRLPAERDLAEEMSVSRQTVRSALIRLQTENLVDVVPRGGAFVRSPRTKILVGPSSPTDVDRVIAEAIKEEDLRLVCYERLVAAPGSSI